MSSKSPKNIIVVGGSLAGLMTGIVLKRLGHHVRIFERNTSSHLQSQGAGIVFGPQAQEYFSKHITPYISRSLTVTSRLRQTLDKDGKQVSEEKRAQEMVSWDLLYFVLRAAFDGLGSGYCILPEREKSEGQAKYEYGRNVVEIRDLGSGRGIEVVSLTQREDETGGETREKDFADFIVAADGPSSAIRKLLLPEVERTYAGYVAWRGTVPENDASDLLKETFVDHFTFYHGPGVQILAYLIPGENGATQPGNRLINWVWYKNYANDSPEHEEVMTDTSGHRWRVSVPVSKVQPHVWTSQKSYAEVVLPHAFSELVQKTKFPFIQAITDVISSQCSFFGNKVLLVGDALAGFRPHTAASTSQAAYHGLLLDEAMKGEITLGEMKEEMMKHARLMVASGIGMGERSQFESLKIEHDQVQYEETTDFRNARANRAK